MKLNYDDDNMRVTLSLSNESTTQEWMLNDNNNNKNDTIAQTMSIDATTEVEESPHHMENANDMLNRD